MSWKLFCELNAVPKKYLNCSLENLPQFKREGLDFLNNSYSLILMGDSGRGKTYFLYALIRRLLEKKGELLPYVRYINALKLEEEVSNYLNNFGSATYFINGLCEVRYLFIDDFGIEATVQRAERNYYAITDSRLANCLPTVFATNLNNEEILEIYGTRVGSRLKQCHRLKFTGGDMRSIQQKRRGNHEQDRDNTRAARGSPSKKIHVQFS